MLLSDVLTLIPLHAPLLLAFVGRPFSTLVWSSDRNLKSVKSIDGLLLSDLKKSNSPILFVFFMFMDRILQVYLGREL